MIRASAPWVMAVILLLTLPHILSANSAITIMSQMAITIVFALSYNMLLGQAGLVSFGHAIYMGMGGFFCIHILNWVSAHDVPLPLPFLPLLSGLFSLGLATIIGAISVHRTGVVFAMISLGIVELIASCAVIIYAFFRGGGVGGDRTLPPAFWGVDFSQQIHIYYLIIFWTVLSALAMYLFTRTPAGRMANAVRDNPDRVEFIGYSAQRVRLISFCAAGFFAGIAGGLFSLSYEIATVENLNVQTSGLILMITFMGGTGIFAGPILGAILFTLVQTVLSLKTDLWQLYMGILFLVTVMYFPTGLAGVLAMHIPILKSGKLKTLLLPYVKVLLPGATAVLSTAAFIEMLFHHRHAATDEPDMSLFWVMTDTGSIGAWLAVITLMLAGYLLARRGVPELIRVWNDASKP